MSAQTDHNKSIVSRLYDEVWNQGKLAVAAEILHHPQGVQRYVAQFRSAFADVQHRVEELIAEDDTVVARWSAHATHTGPWHSLAPAGAPITWTGVTIARLDHGKIREHHTIWDTAGLLEQLGAIPRIRKLDGTRL